MVTMVSPAYADAPVKHDLEGLVFDENPVSGTWTTGNLCQGGGGCYAEGDEVPARLSSENLVPGNPYSVVIEIDHQDGPLIGYDRFDRSTPVLADVGATGVTLSSFSPVTCSSGTTCWDYTLSFTATATKSVIYLDAVLGLDASEWSGSSLHMRMVTGGNSDIPINVRDIERLPSITITKIIVDGQGDPVVDQTSAADYCFDITPVVAGKTRYCITGDGDGTDTIVIDNLQDTSYTIAEVGQEGYIPQSISGTNCVQSQSGVGSATVASGSVSTDAICEFKNTRAIGGLTVTKEVVGPNGEDILDTSADFQFQFGNETFFLTDGGSKTFNDLPTGLYTIDEVVPANYALDSYSIDEDPTTPGAQIYVTGGVATQLTVTNRQVGGSLQITKEVQDSLGNQIKDDAEFTFTYDTGKTVKVTGGSTVEVNGLLPGTYTVIESGIPSNYQLLSITPDNDSDPTNGVEVQVVNGEKTELVAVNALIRPKVVITKTDDVDPVIAGNSFNYYINIQNTGPNVLHDVVLADPVQSTTPFIVENYSTDQGSCTIAPAGTGIDCTVGDVVVGQTVKVRIGVSVPYSIDADSFTNTATMYSYEYPDGLTADETTEVIERFDLSVKKSSSTDLLIPGQDSSFSYDVRVENLGPSDVEGVNMKDIIPAPFTFIGYTLTSTTPGTVLCSTIGNNVDCDISYLRPGDYVVFKLNVSVPLNAESGTILNTAVFTTSETGETEWKAEDQVTIEEKAELDLVKSADKLSVAAGDTFTYTLRLSNLGPSDADNVILTDSIPAMFEILSVDSTDCSLVGNDLTCDVGTLLPDGIAFEVNILVKVDPAATEGEVKNTAYGYSDEDKTDDELVVGIYEDINIYTAKTHSANPVTAGNSTFDYTIVVKNNGLSQTDDLVVYDFLPEEFDYQSYTSTVGTCTYDPSPTFVDGEQLDTRFGVVVMPTDSVGDPILICDLGDLGAGEEVLITVTMDVPVDVDATLPGQGVLNWGWEVTDEQVSDFSDRIDVVEDVVLDLIKTTSDKVLISGQDNAEYKLSLTNTGYSTADNVVLQDVLPAGFEFISADPSPSPCPGSVLPVGTVEWCIGTLKPGETFEVMITAFVVASVQDGSYTNTAYATSDEDKDSDTADVNVDGSATLSIDKELESEDPAIAGQDELMFSILVRNLGPSVADMVTVTDDLSDYLQSLMILGYDLTALDYSVSTDVGSCSAVDLDNYSLTCEIGTLGVYGTSTPLPTEVKIMVTVDVPDVMESGEFENSVVASSEDSEKVSDVAPFEIDEKEYLKIEKSADREEVIAGEISNLITYTVSVTNSGPSSAENVIVDDILPEGLVLESYPTECVEGIGYLHCELGELAVDQTIKFEYVMSAPSVIEGGTYNNYVGTRSDDCMVREVDEDLSEDSRAFLKYCAEDEFDLSVREDVKLVVDKVDSTDPVIAGTEFDYIITVTNEGFSQADKLGITDTIPAQLEAISVDDPNCSINGNNLLCKYDHLDSGETKVVKVTVLALPSLEAQVIENIAYAATEETKGYDEEETTIYEDPTLTVEKLVDRTTAVAGDDTPLTYTITATNEGPSDADNVIVYDFLPDQFQLGTYSSNIGICTVDDTFDPDVSLDLRAVVLPSYPYQTDKVIICDLGTMDPDQTFTLTYEMYVPEGVDSISDPGINNSGSLVSDEKSLKFERDVEITEDVKLVIEKYDNYEDEESAVAGRDYVTYTIEVTNNGESDADNVCVSDLLPEGFVHIFSTPTPETEGCSENSSENPDALEWYFEHVASGETKTITVVVFVESSVLAGSYENLASVKSDEDSNDGSEITDVDVEVNLDMQKEDGDFTAVAGDPVLGYVTYTLTAMNYGPSDATEVTVYDWFPDGFMITEYDDSICTVSLVDGLTSEFDPARWYEMSCMVGALEVGESFTTEVTVWIPYDMDTATYNNYAEANDPDETQYCGDWGIEDDRTRIGLTESELESICYYDNEPIDVVEDVQLDVDKSSDPSVVHPGEEFEYLISVRNGGDSDAENVMITDEMPSVFEIVDVNIEKGECSVDGQTISCTIDKLDPDEIVEMIVTVRASVDAYPDVYTNYVVTSSDEDEGDEDSDDTEVLSIPDMFITKSNDWLGSTEPLSPGDVVRYSITLSVEDLLKKGDDLDEDIEQEINPSAVPLSISKEMIFHGVQDVVLTDLIPEGLSFIPGTSEVVDENGDPVSYSEPVYDDNAGVWMLGDIMVGGKVIVSYDAIVDGDADAGEYSDLAWATGTTPGDVEVLSKADEVDPSYFSENIVGTYVQVALNEFVETGVVLGSAIVRLPNTGVSSLISIVGLLTLLIGLVLFVGDWFKNKRSSKLFLRSGVAGVTAVMMSILLLASAQPALAQVGISISQPDAQTNDNNFKIPYVVANISNENIELACYVKGPSDVAFSTFGVSKSFTKSGTGFCQVDDNVVAENGVYQFKVEGSGYVSDIVEVDFSALVPDAPESYERTESDTCTSTLTFTVPSSSSATKAQIFRSTETSFVASATTLVGELAVSSGEDVEFLDTPSDCNDTYYYSLRLIDEFGNSSTFVGDEVVITQVIDEPVTTTNTSGQGDTGGTVEGAVDTNGDGVIDEKDGEVLGEEETPDDDTKTNEDEADKKDTSEESFVEKYGVIILGLAVVGVVVYWYVRRQRA